MNYPNYNDYELISMVKENDENSYDILYQKYLPILKKIASNYYLKYSNYGYDYEDFLQESHLAFQRALRYFDESRNSLFYTFVTVCLNRRLLSFSQRIVLKSDQYAFLNVDLDQACDVVDEKADMDQIFFDSEMDSMVRKLIVDLPIQYSSVLELKYNDFSYREISKLLDLPHSTVQYRLKKGRDKAKELLSVYSKEKTT